MANAKLPHLASIEDLLKALENKEEPGLDNSGQEVDQVYDFDDDVLGFLQAFKIESGETPIRVTVMYRIYKQWSRNPLGPAMFASKIGRYIPRNNIGNFYTIAANVFNFTKITKELLDHKLKRTKKRINPNYFKKFFDHYSIKSGNTWLEGFILYYLYVEWCDEFRRARQFSGHSFIQALKVFLPFRQANHTFFFRIDEQVLKHLPQSKLDALRKSSGRFHGRKKEK